MSVGAALGLGLFGLFSTFSMFASGAFTPAGLLARLILVVSFVWVWRSFGPFREDLADSNRSGKILGWITLFISAVAAFLSAALLFL
jgi:hypothetical protein